MLKQLPMESSLMIISEGATQVTISSNGIMSFLLFLHLH